MKKKRVVVSGIGIICAIGNNRNEYQENLKKGLCGVKKITAFDTLNWKYQYAAEISSFDFQRSFSSREIRRMDRASQIALVATDEAVNCSGVDFLMTDRERCGVSMGSTLGGMISGGNYYKAGKLKAKFYASLLLDYPLYSAGTRISIKYGLLGPNVVVSTACSSANMAMGYASDLIRSGQMDMMITGGFDTMAELTWAGFGVLRNVSPHFCRPFDKNREGLILGEGAGILVLEELEHCLKRGGKILAEILGYGMSSDAYHMTAPDLTGKGPAQAMINACKDSGIDPERIDYINAHGTGTIYNDLIETKAIKKVFGEKAYKIPISSTKSMTGHTLGAAGAMELIASIVSMNGGFIPPTINYVTPDPQCDLDYVPNVSRDGKINYFLSNNFGFGGNNCCLLAGKCEEAK